VTASILYAEDKFDITKEIIKALNDKYKAPAKTEEKQKLKIIFILIQNCSLLYP
jgi:hypothetical protein